jgi:hypothetical protein
MSKQSYRKLKIQTKQSEDKKLKIIRNSKFKQTIRKKSDKAIRSKQALLEKSTQKYKDQKNTNRKLGLK